MKKSFKALSILVALMMVMSLIAGCGAQPGTVSESPTGSAPAVSESASATASAEPEIEGKITYWHTYGDAEEPFFNDTILPLFKAKYPKIEVEAVKQDSGQYVQTITTAIGTQSNPDVARLEVTHLANYANLDALLNLEELEGFNELKDQMLEGPLTSNIFKGKYYGLPIDTNCKALVADLDVLKNLGLTEAPKTMEEFIEASKKNSPGKYTLNFSGTGDWDSYLYFWLFGGTLTDENFMKASGYMDSPQSIAALQKMIDLHNDKVLTIRDIDGTPDAWDGIMVDEYAMFAEGPWFFPCKPDYKENNIVCSTIPTYNGKSASVVGGSNVVIFKNSKNPQAAFEFVKFLLSEEVQIKMLEVNQMPVLKSAMSADKIKNDPILSVYAKQLESAKSRIPSPEGELISESWKDELTKAFNGEVTAEEALKSAAQKIDAILAK